MSSVSPHNVAGVTAAIGRPRAASLPGVRAFNATVDSRTGNVAEARFSMSAPCPGRLGGVQATFEPSDLDEVTGTFIPASATPDRRIVATRLDPKVKVTAKKVERAVLGIVRLSTHARGTSIVTGMTATQQATTKDLVDAIVNTLKDKKVIKEGVSQINICYDRDAIRYIDTDGKTKEMSILGEMEKHPELREQVRQLAQHAHEIHGTPGYVPMLRHSTVKGSHEGSPALRRSESEQKYRELKSRLATVEEQISKGKLAPRETLPRLKAEQNELKKKIATFVLHERIPKSVAKAKAKIGRDISVDLPVFAARTDQAEKHLKALRNTIKTRIAEKQKELTATPPKPKAEIEKLKKDIAALEDVLFRINEVDEYALTMALAHCPKKGSSDDEIQQAVDRVRSSVDAHYQEEHRKEYEERQVKDRTWGQYILWVPNNPTLDTFKHDYSVDAAGLLLNISSDPSHYYHKLCLEHGTAMKAPHFTDALLTQLIELEKDANHKVEDGLTSYLEDLAEEDKQVIIAALQAARAPAPSPGAATPVVRGTGATPAAPSSLTVT